MTIALVYRDDPQAFLIQDFRNYGKNLFIEGKRRKLNVASRIEKTTQTEIQ
jgi:hypothetical protein